MVCGLHTLVNMDQSFVRLWLDFKSLLHLIEFYDSISDLVKSIMKDVRTGMKLLKVALGDHLTVFLGL